MESIIVFASTPKSHIIPLVPLLKHLKKQYLVHLFTDAQNEFLIKEIGAVYHAYPENIYVKHDLVQPYLEDVGKLWKEKKYKEGYDLFIDRDTEHLYNITMHEIELMTNIVKEINPLFIIRDSADKIGYYLGKTMNLPVIGYITNNLYSRKYFESDPSTLYSLFMNANRKYMQDYKEYFCSYRNRLEIANIKCAKNKNIMPLNVLHQFDPMTEYTLIFSTNFFQPKNSLFDNRIYNIIYPVKERFEIEKNIPKIISTFLDTQLPVIFIASGSIISNFIDYYIKYINGLSSFKCRIIISCKHFYKELTKLIQDYSIDNILILENLPQKYVLSKSSLFITSGGQNSIMESIYFMVPMLVDPITSEQRLNGLIIENLGIGISSNTGKEKSMKTGAAIKYLIESSEVKKKLMLFSNDIKTHENDFRSLDLYIDELKKGL